LKKKNIIKEDFEVKSVTSGIFYNNVSKLYASEESKETENIDLLESYTDDLYESFIHCFGIDNFKSKLISEPQPIKKLQIGKQLIEIRFDRNILKKNNIFIFCFEESKRLEPGAFKWSISQKIAEAITVAQYNYLDGSVKDQEVFGIGVRHTFFTFYHAFFPADVLQKFTIGKDLDQNEIIKMKFYPNNSYGLDISDPKERDIIIEMFLTLINYIQSGKCKIGDY